MDSGIDTGQVTLAGVTDYAIWVVRNADTIWSSWMTGRGYAEPYVHVFIVQPGQPLDAPDCGVSDPRRNNASTTRFDSAFPNAFYCGAQHNGVDYGIIILPVESLAKMWSGEILGRAVSDPAKVGDFAAATVVAHEFGHHVQHEMAVAASAKPPTGKNAELLADCFAGAWTTSLYQQGGLEEGDIDEALNALAAIGDGPNPVQPHGTPAERDTAFRIGIYGTTSDPRGGVPANCITSYWPEFNGPQ